MSGPAHGADEAPDALGSDAAAPVGDDWGSRLDAQLADAGLTPPPGWEEGEAESARQFEVQRLRLQVGLAEQRRSPTLVAMATLGPTGEVIGMGYRFTPIEHAWTCGAPASLIAEADRLDAALAASGRPGSRQWMRTAIRLAWWIRDLNRRLRPYNGLRRTFSVATHRDTVSLADRLALAAESVSDAEQLLARHEASITPITRTGPPGAIPAPLTDPDTVAPLLRTGPPAPRVSVAA